MNRDELIEQIAKLVPNNPSEWADSQIEEGIDQLSRAKALAMLWSSVAKFNDRTMIRTESKCLPETERPFGLYGMILKHMLEAGITENEIMYFIQCNQVEIINGIVGVSDGFSEDEPFGDVRLPIVNDENNEVILPDGLHESILEFAPNEMIPPLEVIADLKERGYC
jgi:hypothetical protein